MKELSIEEKDLLLKDISGRLQSGLKVCCINLSDEMPKVWDLIGMPAPHLADILVEGSHRFAAVNIEESIRPYLRPMSSMTEDEYEEFCKTDKLMATLLEINKLGIQGTRECHLMVAKALGERVTEQQNWLNSYHFDYRGLIPIGLGIDCTGLNIYENEKSI